MSLIKEILIFALKTLSYQYVVKRTKRKVLIIYLKSLQVVRKSLIAAFAVFFSFQLMIFGFIGSVIMSIWLWPTLDYESKLWALFIFFLILFLLPLIILCIALSEKFWFHLSGVKKIIHQTSIEK